MGIALAIESRVKHMWIKWKRRFLYPQRVFPGDEMRERFAYPCSLFFFLLYHSRWRFLHFRCQKCKVVPASVYRKLNNDSDKSIIDVSWCLETYRQSGYGIVSLMDLRSIRYYTRITKHMTTLTLTKVLEIINEYYASKKNHVIFLRKYLWDKHK